MVITKRIFTETLIVRFGMLVRGSLGIPQFIVPSVGTG